MTRRNPVAGVESRAFLGLLCASMILECSFPTWIVFNFVILLRCLLLNTSQFVGISLSRALNSMLHLLNRSQLSKLKSCRRKCGSFYTTWPHLQQEHLQLVSMCRSFADNELKPIASQIDKDCSVPKDKLRKLSELGLFGIDIPSEYGGAGMDSLSYVIAIEEIGRGCASSAILMCSAKFFCAPILQYGTASQKAFYIHQW